MAQVPPSRPPEEGDAVAGSREPSVGAPGVPLEPEGGATLFLLPGALLVAEQPTRIGALLGACVAVCLWEPQLRLAAVSHFALPRAEGTGPGGPELAGRYGDASTRRLVEEMRRRGCEPGRLEAKVFGGAHLAPGRILAPGSLPASGGDAARVGERNVAVALEVLREAGVRLCAADVGGNRGRRLVLHTGVGRAWVRHL